MKNLIEFFRWEEGSRDAIHIKRIYIDMAGDLVAGVMLSQIIYWNLPDKNGKSKLRVKKEGLLWLAKSRTDWWAECRITPKQADRAIKILRNNGLVITAQFKFNGAPTTHIRIDEQGFLSALDKRLDQGAPIGKNSKESNAINQDGTHLLPKGEFQSHERVNSLTENTTNTPTDITNIEEVDASAFASASSHFEEEEEKTFGRNEKNVGAGEVTPIETILKRPEAQNDASAKTSRNTRSKLPAFSGPNAELKQRLFNLSQEGRKYPLSETRQRKEIKALDELIDIIRAKEQEAWACYEFKRDKEMKASKDGGSFLPASWALVKDDFPDWVGEGCPKKYRKPGVMRVCLNDAPDRNSFPGIPGIKIRPRQPEKKEPPTPRTDLNWLDKF